MITFIKPEILERFIVNKKKIIWLSVIMIATIFIHGLLKMAKDALVISSIGTEMISAIKLWFVIPCSILFVVLYIKLSNRYNRNKLPHIINLFFLSFFVLFTIVLYPNRESLSLHLPTSAPVFGYLFNILNNWIYSLYYIFSEMWASIMMSITFWQITNHITAKQDSLWLYPVLGLVAQLGLIIAGFVSNIAIDSVWQITLDRLLASILIGGSVISLGYYMLSKRSNKETSVYVNKKYEYNVLESIKIVCKSKTIFYITCLLLSYNVSINLIECIWKKYIEIRFNSDASQILQYMGYVTTSIGIVGIAASVITILYLYKKRWTIVAGITPAIIFVTGAAFFLFAFFFGADMLAVTLLLGSTNNAFARGSKHVLFDSTKESLYINLPDEIRTKGKAVAEMIGMRFGKSSGAFLQQVLFACTGLGLMELTPVIGGIFCLTCLIWFFCIYKINRTDMNS